MPSLKNINYRQFYKGQHLSIQEVEQLVGVTHTGRTYAGYAKNLANAIQKNLTEELKIPCVVRVREGGEVWIFTDQEASDAIWEDFNSRKRSIDKLFKEATCNIVRANLSVEENARHNARITYLHKATMDLNAKSAKTIDELIETDVTQSISHNLKQSNAKKQKQKSSQSQPAQVKLKP